MSAANASEDRVRDALDTVMGVCVRDLLLDAEVREIMRNADGKLWVDRVGVGREHVGFMNDADAEAVLRFVASGAHAEVTASKPVVTGRLPGTTARFQGLMPPASSTSIFTIRKHAERVYLLSDYVATGIMSDRAAGVLREAVKDKRNILIAGGTSSGKTTLLNAILAEPEFAHDRIIILEDTPELQSTAEDCNFLLASDDDTGTSMQELVRHTLRLRPDRIVLGEVRSGAVALDVLKAMNTGHPGSVTTIHANSACDAISRLEMLTLEVLQNVPHQLVRSAIDLVVFICRGPFPAGRSVTQMREVSRTSTGDHTFTEITF